MKEELVKPLLNEANEILAIIVTSKKSARKNKSKIKSKIGNQENKS